MHVHIQRMILRILASALFIQHARGGRADSWRKEDEPAPQNTEFFSDAEFHSSFEPEVAPQIAESTVLLSRIHPVHPDNYPSSMLELCEARIPHYHVERLRSAHQQHREGSSAATGSVQLHAPAPTDDDDSPWVQALFSAIQAEDNTNAKALSSEASVRMTNLRDSQYVGPLKVGSKGDILSVVYDTGSTNLWFASTLCTEGPCLRRRRYDPEHSDTFKLGDYDLKVTFGTGELHGSQGIDDVDVGGFKVKQQTFSLIQKEEGKIFDELNFEGILGLAFPSMSANKVPPLFDQVMNQKLLGENSFSFYFTKYPLDASAVLFGKVDDRLYEGDLVRFPVTDEFYWTVGLKHFKLGDQLIDGPKKVVFDTGTTYYSAPKHIFPTLLAEMPQTHCQAIRDGSSNLPNMTFTFSNHDGQDVQLVMTPAEYYVSSGMDGHCDPAWMNIDVPARHGPAFIFGEAFMRSYFTSFYRGNGNEQPEVKVAPMNRDAVSLVEGVKKVTGSSDNQKSLMQVSSLLQDDESLGHGQRFRKSTQIVDPAGRLDHE